MAGLGLGRLVVCVLDKKLGKMRSNLMDHGGRHRHTAPLWDNTPGNKARNNQLTSYATGLLLKLEKNYY
jgi:hypothetical protein